MWSHWDEVARIAGFPKAAGLRPSQTRRAALHEAAKSTTRVRSTWLFANDKTIKVAKYSPRWRLLEMCRIFICINGSYSGLVL